MSALKVLIANAGCMYQYAKGMMNLALVLGFHHHQLQNQLLILRNCVRPVPTANVGKIHPCALVLSTSPAIVHAVQMILLGAPSTRALICRHPLVIAVHVEMSAAQRMPSLLFAQIPNAVSHVTLTMITAIIWIPMAVRQIYAVMMNIVGFVETAARRLIAMHPVLMEYVVSLHVPMALLTATASIPTVAKLTCSRM